MNKAVSYYQEIGAGLGSDFAIEVQSAIQLIKMFPSAWPVLNGKTRRSLTRQFPFGVLYYEISNGIYVLAIMNLQKHPDY